MKEDKIIYCVYCGTKNNFKDEKCIKCHQKLHPKNRPLLDYLKSQIKEELLGKVEDNIFSVITNYIKSHLYGFILTCSIIISTASVVANIVDTPRMQKVEERPVVEDISYIGEGLSALDVARLYVEKVKANDMKSVKRLQLETFYPDIIKYLENYALSNPNSYPEPVVEHNLVTNREILLKNNIDIPYIGESESVYPSGTFGIYPFVGFMVSISYCSYNQCTGTYPDYHAFENIYLIEVEGNYYVLKEEVGALMSVEDAVKRKALFNANGDTSNLSFEEVIKEFDNCNLDEACLEALGYNDLYTD